MEEKRTRGRTEIIKEECSSIITGDFGVASHQLPSLVKLVLIHLGSSSLHGTNKSCSWDFH
jgi:hypothetical protein